METTKEKFRVTGKITKLLGTESVSDKATALKEILKNSHDADALFVDVKFQDFEKGLGKIVIIEEKGDGMTYDQIKNRFLVIGTYAKEPPPSKKKNSVEKELEEKVEVKRTERLQRIMVGRKGVGRFALEKLGSKVKIISKPFGTNDKFTFEIDWKRFEVPDIDIGTPTILIYKDSRTDKNDSGLEIEISDLNDVWDQEEILDFKKSLISLIPPKELQPENSFVVYLEATTYGIPREKIETKLEENAFYYLEAELKNGTIELFSKQLGQKFKSGVLTEIDSYTTDKKNIPVSKLICGPARLEVSYFPTFRKSDKLRKYYYDKAIKRYGETLHKDIPEIMEKTHGVRIIKDGLREFNYGDVGHDWAARDEITRGLSGTVQANRLLGFCIISSETNPRIVPTTNRTEAIENQAFKDLRDFMIASMSWLDKKINQQRRKRMIIYNQSVIATASNLKKLATIISKPKIAERIKNFESEIYNDLNEELNLIPTIQNTSKTLEEREKGEEEIITQDLMTLTNAALGDYLTRIYHDFVEPVAGLVQIGVDELISLSKWKEFKDSKEFKEISNDIDDAWDTLTIFFDAIEGLTEGLGVQDYYKRKKIKILLPEKIDEVFNALTKLLEFDDVKLEDTISKKLELNIYGPMIYSLIYNLISNSLKAFKDQNKKDKAGNKILISHKIDKKFLNLFYSDNSTEGIPKQRWKIVFEERITSTSKHKILPGQGLGLFILRRMLEHHNGEIEIVNPHYGAGTTFMIKIPKEFIETN